MSPGWDDVLDVLARGGQLSRAEYNRAGGFTRFLIDRHGADAYREFYTGLRYRDALPQIEAVHAERFGESLTETILAFEAEDRRHCPRDRFRLKLRECSAPTIEWDDDSLLLRRSLTCGDADVIGPFADDTARAYATLEVATAGYFELNLASDEPWSTALFAGCGGCEDKTAAELRVGGEPVRMWIPAGRYFLNLSGDVDVATTAALSMQGVDGP